MPHSFSYAVSMNLEHSIKEGSHERYTDHLQCFRNIKKIKYPDFQAMTISKQVGRYEEMFCEDPQGRTENRDQNIFKEYKEAKKLGDTLVHEKAERKHAQEEKQKKRMKVVNFKL